MPWEWLKNYVGEDVLFVFQCCLLNSWKKSVMTPPNYHCWKAVWENQNYGFCYFQRNYFVTYSPELLEYVFTISPPPKRQYALQSLCEAVQSGSPSMILSRYRNHLKCEHCKDSHFPDLFILSVRGSAMETISSMHGIFDMNWYKQNVCESHELCGLVALY